MDLNKIFKLVLIIAILTATISISYYYVYFVPQKERAKLELQKQEQIYEEQGIREKETKELLQRQSLEFCLSDTEKYYKELTAKGVESCNKYPDSAYECGLSLFDEVEKGLKEAKDECFKKYPIQ